MKDSMVHQARTLAALTDISRYISSSLDYKKIAYQCLESLKENLELEKCGLLMPQGGSGDFELEAGIGWREQEFESCKDDLIQKTVRPTFNSGMVVALLDATEIPGLYIPRELSRDNPVVGFIAVPVLVNHKSIGVLIAYRISFRTKIDEDVIVMKIVASILSQTLKLADLIEQNNKKLQTENAALHAELEGKFEIENFILSSSSMHTTVEMIRRVAYTDATVLMRGESGTGKTMIAKGLHYNSPRKQGAFVIVNCAAIPPNLMESELFGHEKGAFTGATTRRIGRFEAAEGGSVFLDEVGEIPVELQAKLLHVIQERSFQRVGSNESIRCDVRIICATNVNLEDAVKNKTFREDLYYRLMVVPIYLPSLRARKADILPLAHHFLGKYNSKYNKDLRLSGEASTFIQDYNWPGNVRELENTLERSVILAQGPEVTVNDVSLLGPLMSNLSREAGESPGTGVTDNSSSPPQTPPAKKRALYERVPIKEENVRSALNEAAGIQTLAARNLGISLRQLRYAIKKYNLDAKTFKS